MISYLGQEQRHQDHSLPHHAHTMDMGTSDKMTQNMTDYSDIVDLLLRSGIKNHLLSKGNFGLLSADCLSAVHIRIREDSSNTLMTLYSGKLGISYVYGVSSVGTDTLRSLVARYGTSGDKGAYLLSRDIGIFLPREEDVIIIRRDQLHKYLLHRCPGSKHPSVTISLNGDHEFDITNMPGIIDSIRSWTRK